MIARVYEVELWSRGGVMIADISSLVQNLKYSMQRNAAESLSFDINLFAFEELCQTLGVLPRTILYPYNNDVKIKRNGEYLFGTHIGDLSVSLDVDEQNISVNAFGYLDLLKDRYVTKTYTNEWDTDIVWDLIDTTQSETNGDLGMALGDFSVQLQKRDRTYDKQNVKDAIVNLTNLENGNFDFEFTYDRKLNTYEMMGSDRTTEMIFSYPDNVISARIPRTGTRTFNKVYAIGAGFGDDALQTIVQDNTSQLNYGLHETTRSWNSVLDATTLSENANGYLNLTKDILELPQMVVSGVDFDLNKYGIGDRVTVKMKDHLYLNNIFGTYRIERLEVSVDENESETINVYFDDKDITE